MKEVNLYLMTSIASPKPASGRYVFIFEMPRDNNQAVTLTVDGDIEQETSNSAEILILEKALKRTKPCILTIFTENTYLASAIELWLDNWKAKDFKDAKGEDIKYKDRWESISKMLENIPHSIRLNEKHTFREWMISEVKGEKNGNK